MKNNITLFTFIFKVGEDYLSFLRNLAPTVLFLSLALFGLTELQHGHWNLEKFGILIFALGALFIASIAIVVNISIFAKKALKALYELQNKEQKVFDFWGFLKHIWVEGNAKVVIFLFLINIIAIMMVITYGMNYAFNFYRAISSFAD